jgi:hypothetical protein
MGRRTAEPVAAIHIGKGCYFLRKNFAHAARKTTSHPREMTSVFRHQHEKRRATPAARMIAIRFGVDTCIDHGGGARQPRIGGGEMKTSNHAYIAVCKAMPEVARQIDTVADLARKRFRADEINELLMDGFAVNLATANALIKFEIAMRQDFDVEQVPA